MGVISAMVEKELGERNLRFDSLKSRLNRDMQRHRPLRARDMEEAAEGLLSSRYKPLPSPLPRHGQWQRGSGGRQSQETISPPCRSSVCRLLQIDVDVEVEQPETSENLTQSFEIHYIFRRRTQLLAVIIYSI